jgi:hypothetical protein
MRNFDSFRKFTIKNIVDSDGAGSSRKSIVSYGPTSCRRVIATDSGVVNG